jgi:hypothetical protein
VRVPLRLGVTFGILVTVSGGALVAERLKVSVEHDEKTDFSTLRTYEWLPTPPYKIAVAPQARDARFEREALDGPIRAAVDAALGARRFTPAAPGSTADVLVVYYVALGASMSTDVLGSHYAYVTGWSTGLPAATPTTSLRVIEEGTLVVDILRGDRSTAIWRGTARGAVDRARTQEQRLRAIDEAVAKMMAKFPPRR